MLFAQLGRRRTIFPAFLLACATSLSSAAALAQTAAPPSGAQPVDPGHDEVTLKGGGMLRGTVLGMEPGKEVVLLFAGKPAFWSQVEQVTPGTHLIRLRLRRRPS
jgi:hypothetical protein